MTNLSLLNILANYTMTFDFFGPDYELERKRLKLVIWAGIVILLLPVKVVLPTLIIIFFLLLSMPLTTATILSVILIILLLISGL